MASKSTSKTLFVGNLHASLEESDLLNVFKPFGNVVECCKKVQKVTFFYLKKNFKHKNRQINSKNVYI